MLLIKNIDDKLKIVKTLTSKPRLHALFFLFIYRKISLVELAKLLNKSKNTIVYHMKMMVNQGIVTEFDVSKKGSIKPSRFYELNPDFYERVSIPFDNLENLSDEKILSYSKNIFRWNIVLFETMREFFKQICSLYSERGKKINKSEEAIKFHNKNSIPRDLIPLSNDGYKKYQEYYHNFMEKTNSLIEDEKNQDSDVIHPFLAFNTVLPIKKLLEFHQRKK